MDGKKHPAAHSLIYDYYFHQGKVGKDEHFREDLKKSIDI